MQDSGPWAHCATVSRGSTHSTPDPDLNFLRNRATTTGQSTGTWSSFNDRATTTHQTAPTSTWSGSEAGSNVDQKEIIRGSRSDAFDHHISFIEDKLGVGAISSGKDKKSFNRDLVKGIGQNEVLLEKQDESLGKFFFEFPSAPGSTSYVQQRRPWVDTLPVNSGQSKLESTPRSEPDNARAYQHSGSQVSFPPRDIESQEDPERPGRRATRAGMLLRFYFYKTFTTLGKNLIKLFYPPSMKKARRLVALTIIATAFTVVALLWRAGHSVADMSMPVLAICALGDFLYKRLADSSMQELRRLLRTLSGQAGDDW